MGLTFAEMISGSGGRPARHRGRSWHVRDGLASATDDDIAGGSLSKTAVSCLQEGPPGRSVKNEDPDIRRTRRASRKAATHPAQAPGQMIFNSARRKSPVAD